MTAIREFRIHRFSGPEVLQADAVEPSLPDASQVLVAVKAASVNPVDFKIEAYREPVRELMHRDMMHRSPLIARDDHDLLHDAFVVERLRFKSATDSAGNPVPAPFYWRQRWF